MVTLKTYGKFVLEIDESAIQGILDIYSDEPLLGRPIFANALEDKTISFSELKKECDSLFITWQLFLLEPENLKKQLAAIQERRNGHIDKKLLASRDGDGKGVSLRLADRLIALQAFAKKDVSKVNEFCGALKNKPRSKWSSYIVEFFDLELSKLSGGSKEKTLDYLIDKIENKNIRVARGVLSYQMVPAVNEVRESLRKSSGFVVADENVPYIFLPNEFSDNDTAGRQILTLMALIVMIGLEDYSLYITGQLELSYTKGANLAQAFRVASEILLPKDKTDELVPGSITPEIRDQLAAHYMLTPSALSVTLKHRGLVKDDEELENLLKSVKSNPGSSFKTSANIENAVPKFCSESTNREIVQGLRTNTLSSIDAQYLIFGRVNKVLFEKYRNGVGL